MASDVLRHTTPVRITDEIENTAAKWGRVEIRNNRVRAIQVVRYARQLCGELNFGYLTARSKRCWICIPDGNDLNSVEIKWPLFHVAEVVGCCLRDLPQNLLLVVVAARPNTRYATELFFRQRAPFQKSC